MASVSPPPRVLRVGVLHDDRIVEERQLPPHAPVTVGSAPGSTLVLPAADLPPGAAPARVLFEPRGDGWALVFDARMQGRVHLGPATPDGAALDVELEALRHEEGPAEWTGEAWVLPLTGAARGTVRLGAASLLFQLLPAPAASVREAAAPARARRRGARRRAAAVAAAALALGLGALGALRAGLVGGSGPSAPAVAGRTPPPAAPRVLVHAPAAAVRPPPAREAAAWREAEATRAAPPARAAVRAAAAEAPSERADAPRADGGVEADRSAGPLGAR